MTTRDRHLSTKFAEDSTDPAQLIGRGVGQSMDFWDFLALLKEILKICFFLLPGAIVRILVQIQKGALQISKKIFIYRLQKNVLLAIPFLLLETKTHFSKCSRLPTSNVAQFH